MGYNVWEIYTMSQNRARSRRVYHPLLLPLTSQTDMNQRARPDPRVDPLLKQHNQHHSFLFGSQGPAAQTPTTQGVVGDSADSFTYLFGEGGSPDDTSSPGLGKHMFIQDKITVAYQDLVYTNFDTVGWNNNEDREASCEFICASTCGYECAGGATSSTGAIDTCTLTGPCWCKKKAGASPGSIKQPCDLKVGYTLVRKYLNNKGVGYDSLTLALEALENDIQSTRTVLGEVHIPNPRLIPSITICIGPGTTWVSRNDQRWFDNAATGGSTNQHIPGRQARKMMDEWGGINRMSQPRNLQNGTSIIGQPYYESGGLPEGTPWPQNRLIGEVKIIGTGQGSSIMRGSVMLEIFGLMRLRDGINTMTSIPIFRDEAMNFSLHH